MASPDAAITSQLAKLDLAVPVPQHEEVPSPVQMVDTPAQVKAMLDTLTSPPSSSSALYMDLEGVNLSRHGTISLIQIFAPPREHLYIVDVHTLGAQTFETRSKRGKTLKHVLESASVKKHLFDVRNDADALYALFGISLAGVVDVQLLECASRIGARHVLCGLAACVEQEGVLTPSASQRWQSVKSEGKKMFDPKAGGSYEVFNTRPLPNVLVEYCDGDVRCLPALSALYQSRLNGQWAGKVRVETIKRVEEAMSPGYEAKGKKKVLGPKKWRFLPTGQAAPGKKHKQQRASQATMAAAGSSSSRQSRKLQVSGGRNATAGPSSTYTPSSELRTGAATPASRGASWSPAANLTISKPVHCQNLNAPPQPSTRDDGLRHRPIAFTPEGAKVQKGGQRQRHGRAPPSWDMEDPDCLEDPDYLEDSDYWEDPDYLEAAGLMQEQNWALCDKDCGWCGHCGDGIL